MPAFLIVIIVVSLQPARRRDPRRPRPQGATAESPDFGDTESPKVPPLSARHTPRRSNVQVSKADVRLATAAVVTALTSRLAAAERQRWRPRLTGATDGQRRAARSNTSALPVRSSTSTRSGSTTVASSPTSAGRSTAGWWRSRSRQRPRGLQHAGRRPGHRHRHLQRGRQEWSFTVKDGVKWEDGADITCDDFKYGASRVVRDDVITGGPELPAELPRHPDRPQGRLPAYKGPYRRARARTCSTRP